MNPRLLVISLLITGFSFGPSVHAQSNTGAKRLQDLLKQFPAADTNKDGQLTWREGGRLSQQNWRDATPPKNENGYSGTRCT